MGEAAVLAAVAGLDAGAAALDAIAIEGRNPVSVGMDGIVEVAFVGSGGGGCDDVGGVKDSEEYLQGAGSLGEDRHDCRLLGFAV